EVVSEHMFQPPENELAATARVNDERTVVWQQLLCERLGFQSRMTRESQHDPVRHRVEKAQDRCRDPVFRLLKDAPDRCEGLVQPSSRGDGYVAGQLRI